MRLALPFAAIAATVLLVEGCALFQAHHRPAAEVQVQLTPEKIERGRYLANNQMACMTCHSPLTHDTHTPVVGKLGAGGREFGRVGGLPGVIYSTNLTPDPETGLGSWSDGEILRALREGVSKDGHALFPLMPYPNYQAMSDEDATAIIAYLRSLPPVKNPIPSRELDFPVNMIVNTIPKPVEGTVPPPPSDMVKRGAYIAAMASCAECHTPRTPQGAPVEGKHFAGGFTFKDADLPGGVKMPNITSHEEDGLGVWSDEQIEGAIRYGQRPDGSRLHPVMPWPAYNGMSDQDMEALIAYLRTVPGVADE